ncbi:nucleotidyltransferase substrate binding protein [Variovorax sp. KK3]|uniref:nucleotidyltransferase substrate binding protein n=1 Tax=Variovorax sp. KK3 TaxID=1855728 RepID=UPI00097BCA7A|nr:nucleotidyltransferase substrate binding protein [Variovorax sp. KK3]
MTNTPDVRWQQRLDNYGRALAQLTGAVALAAQRPLSELEQQGLIQAFEFTHELAWKVMKDYLDYQGGYQITGSRDATRQAFAVGLVEDGDTWMEMIQSRNQSSHTFDCATATALAQRISSGYAAPLKAFAFKMEALRGM